MYISTVEKCGDDYIIPLPDEVVEALNLKDGDQMKVEIQVRDEVVIVLKME